MKNDKEALIIFARNSVKGKVKTRIAEILGDDKALEIYKKLLVMTYENTKKLECKKYIYYTDFPYHNIFDLSYELKIQSEGDLGIRMRNSFKEIFTLGYDKVIISGTDCPGLNEDIIKQAFDSLDDSDLVFGPAVDGGYYLIGMKKMYEYFFEDIKWSTKHVLEDSVKKAKENNLKYVLQETLADVDTPEDLVKMAGLFDS